MDETDALRDLAGDLEALDCADWTDTPRDEWTPAQQRAFERSGRDARAFFRLLEARWGEDQPVPREVAGDVG
jgi:hypothetical protein